MPGRELEGNCAGKLTIVVETNSCWVIEQEMGGRLADEESGNEATGETRKGRHCEGGQLRDSEVFGK